MRNPELENRVQRIRRYIRKVLNQKRIEKNLKFSDITNILSIKKRIIKDYGIISANMDVAIFFVLCEELDIDVFKLIGEIYSITNN